MPDDRRSVSPASSAAASQAATVAADVNSALATQLAAMQKALTKTVETTLGDAERRLQEQIETNHKQLNTRIDSQDTRMEQLERSLATVLSPSPSSPVDANMGGDGRSADGQRTKRVRSEPPPACGERMRAVDANLLWCGGLPCELIRSSLEQIAADVLKKLPSASAAKCTFVGRGFANHFQIRCPDASTASSLLVACYASPISHEISGHGRVPVRVRRSRTASERVVTRALGHLWTKVQQALEGGEYWGKQDRLGTDPRRGILFFVQEGVAHRLFEAKYEQDVIIINPGDKVKHLEIADDTIQQWIRAAIESVQPRI